MNSSIHQHREIRSLDEFLRAWLEREEELRRFAERRANRAPHLRIDADGALQSAAASLIRMARKGEVENPDGNKFIGFMYTLVRRKVAKQARTASTKRRGGGSTPISLDAQNGQGAALDPQGGELDPYLVAAAKDEARRLFGLLDDTDLERIAIMDLEGFTNQEIADTMGKSRATIARKIALIRDIWREEAGQPVASTE